MANAGGKRKATGECLAEANQIGNYSAVLAGEPLSGASKAGVNFIENEQRAEFVGKFSEQRQKFRGRNIDAAARLNGFGQNRADAFAPEKMADLKFDRGEVGMPFRKRRKMAELPQLRQKRAAKKFPMGDVERAVAESVVCAGKSDDAGFFGRERCGFERGFYGLKTGIAENDFSSFGF